MNTYLVSIQYQAITCKHRHNVTLYVRTSSEEKAIEYARNLEHSEDYTIRRINIKYIEVHEVA